ncbi:MAG: hypothetical protein O2799_07040 [Planctomycetota bacterium]|nr:hypothetical protein [Planctomycetota bacterium]
MLGRLCVLLLLAGCSAQQGVVRPRRASVDSWRPTGAYVAVDAQRGARAFVPEGWKPSSGTWRVHMPAITAIGVAPAGQGEDLDVAWACQFLHSQVLRDLHQAGVEATGQQRPGLGRMTVRLEPLRGGSSTSEQLVLHLESTVDAPAGQPLILRVPVTRPTGADAVVEGWSENRTLLRAWSRDLVDALTRLRGLPMRT